MTYFLSFDAEPDLLKLSVLAMGLPSADGLLTKVRPDRSSDAPGCASLDWSSMRLWGITFWVFVRLRICYTTYE